jgi:hypothetical protein
MSARAAASRRTGQGRRGGRRTVVPRGLHAPHQGVEGLDGQSGVEPVGVQAGARATQRQRRQRRGELARHPGDGGDGHAGDGRDPLGPVLRLDQGFEAQPHGPGAIPPVLEPEGPFPHEGLVIEPLAHDDVGDAEGQGPIRARADRDPLVRLGRRDREAWVHVNDAGPPPRRALPEVGEGARLAHRRVAGLQEARPEGEHVARTLQVVGNGFVEPLGEAHELARGLAPVRRGHVVGRSVRLQEALEEVRHEAAHVARDGHEAVRLPAGADVPQALRRMARASSHQSPARSAGPLLHRWIRSGSYRACRPAAPFGQRVPRLMGW